MGVRDGRLTMNLRSIHRALAWWLVAPLFLLIVTGVTYRVGRTWVGIDKETGDRILGFHDASVLGDVASTAYIIVVGVGLLVLGIAGFRLLFSRRGKIWIRNGHRLLGAAILLPLILSAVTGVAYKIGAGWVGAPEGTLDVLMDIHQGSWLGPTGRVFYILFVGGGLLAAAVSGIVSVRAVRRTSASSANPL